MYKILFYSYRLPDPGIPLSVNGPVFTVNIVDNNKTISGSLRQPVAIDFKQLETKNRTSPQCVYWQYSKG